MVGKWILFDLFLCATLTLAQATTQPAPPDRTSQHYLDAVDKARAQFHAAVAKLAKSRDVKIAAVDQSSAQLKAHATEAYSDAVDKLARAYANGRQSAMAQAAAGYDQQLWNAMRSGKADLVTAIKAERDRFVGEVATEEKNASQDARTLRGPAALPPPTEIPIVRGPVIANEIVTVTDDFIVDIYQNGQKVPDSARSLLDEMFGATAEKIKIEVNRGDWIVFNVANDRMRWGGAYGFIAAGLTKSGAVAFVTNPSNHLWSYCDDVDKVNQFISEPGFMQYHYVMIPTHPWDNQSKLNGTVPNSGAITIWGGVRNTWIKFVANVPQ